MVYGIKDAPRDKYLWCTGYRFDKTKAGINCKPCYGKIKDKDDGNSVFTVMGEKDITVMQNGKSRGYSFSDDYEDAVHTFNIAVIIYKTEYEDKLNKIKSAKIEIKK